MKQRTVLIGLAAAVLPMMAATALDWQKKEVREASTVELAPVPARTQMSKKTQKVKRANNKGTEYLVVGRSIFNENGANVFPDGGWEVSYPCYVDFDDAKGKVTFDGLFRDEVTDNLKPATLNWDSAMGMVHASTPDSFSSKDECIYLGDYDSDVIYALQGGEVYGIGYWKSYEEVNMEVSADRSLITPTCALGCRMFVYSEDDKVYLAGRSFDEVMFDTRMYKRTEGVSAIASTEELDFGGSYKGESKSLVFSVVNPGRDEGDFVVSISNPAFVVNTPTGSLEAGSCTQMVVTFTPTEAGEYEGELIVRSDDTECKVMLHGTGEDTPDYSQIVKEGADLMTFATSNEYPFLLSSDYGKSTVAVSSNAGVAKSSSWFEAAFTVPEGSRGTFNYAGYFYPRWASYDEFVVYVDGEEAYASDTSKQNKGELNGALPLLPGDHIVRFEYNKGAIFNSPEIEMGEDYAYISSMSLKLQPYMAQDASLSADTYDFGTLYAVNSMVTATSQDELTIRNNGYEPLEITSTGKSSNFTIVTPKTVAPNETAFLTITFSATELKEYKETLKIVTSAGEFPVHLKAKVEEFPDYSQIVSEGDFTFVGGQHPFIIKDGEAVNPTLPKGKEVICEFTAGFKVPRGKVGLLTWKGHADCGDGDEGMIMFDADPYSIIDYTGDVDAGSYTAHATYCWLKPGDHTISFGYLHSGTSEYKGSNTFRISDLSLEIYDDTPAMVLWEPTPIEFKPIYPGTMDFHQLSLYNLDYRNEENIAITAVDVPENFYCDFNAASFSAIPVLATSRLTIAAAPKKAGRFSGEFVLHTTRGEVHIPVVCEGKDDSSLIYHEEFENEELPGWTIIDKNGDEKTWGYGTEKLANTGKGCLTFNSNFLKQDAEDYIVSPEIKIPEKGATLVYYRAYSNGDAAQDYKVLAGIGDNLDNYVEVGADEGISVDKDFEEVVVSLDQFAGKTIRICFANFTKAGVKNLLKIDDVAVIAGKLGSVSEAFEESPVVETRFYTIEGMEVAHPTKGFYIVRKTYANGKTVSRKMKF